MGLLARQKPCKDRLADRSALMQLGAAVEAQKAALEHAVTLGFEIGIHHADPLVVRKIFERGALGPLPVSEMRIIEHDHAALGTDIGSLRSVGGDQARIAVVPGIADERFDRVGERHVKTQDLQKEARQEADYRRSGVAM